MRSTQQLEASAEKQPISLVVPAIVACARADEPYQSKDEGIHLPVCKVKSVKDQDLEGKAYSSEMHLIRDTVVNFIFAGKDTTSNSMSFFIIMMNRYPRVLEKLTYLEAAIRENLRLNPVALLVPRQATEDLVLCDGTPVAKGTALPSRSTLYCSGRLNSIWGEDALEFKRERWIDPVTGKLLVVSPFKAMPFLSGPRQCTGMTSAMMEMKCALALLFDNFDLETVENPWSMTYEGALTMTVKGPLEVKISSLSDGGAARGQHHQLDLRE